MHFIFGYFVNILAVALGEVLLQLFALTHKSAILDLALVLSHLAARCMLFDVLDIYLLPAAIDARALQCIDKFFQYPRWQVVGIMLAATRALRFSYTIDAVLAEEVVTARRFVWVLCNIVAVYTHVIFELNLEFVHLSTWASVRVERYCEMRE